MLIQLFRGRLSLKNVHATIPKGNMGYDQYPVPGSVAVEPIFLLLSFRTCKHMSMASRAILSNFFENQWTQNHAQYLSGLSHGLHPTTFHIFTRLRLFSFKFGSFTNIKALLSMSKVLKKPWKGLLLPLSLPQVQKLFIKTQNLLKQWEQS